MSGACCVESASLFETSAPLTEETQAERRITVTKSSSAYAPSTLHPHSCFMLMPRFRSPKPAVTKLRVTQLSTGGKTRGGRTGDGHIWTLVDNGAPKYETVDGLQKRIVMSTASGISSPWSSSWLRIQPGQYGSAVPANMSIRWSK
jgi:hypothetical protein